MSGKMRLKRSTFSRRPVQVAKGRPPALTTGATVSATNPSAGWMKWHIEQISVMLHFRYSRCMANRMTPCTSNLHHAAKVGMYKSFILAQIFGLQVKFCPKFSLLLLCILILSFHLLFFFFNVQLYMHSYNNIYVL